MKWFGFISMVCFLVSYAPQLLRTYRTRNVDGISTLYWAIIVTGYVSGLAYVLPLHFQLLVWTYAIGLVLAAAMLVGCVVFRER